MTIAALLMFIGACWIVKHLFLWLTPKPDYEPYERDPNDLPF